VHLQRALNAVDFDAEFDNDLRGGLLETRII